MGRPEGPKLMNCEECGRVIEEDSHFCQFCGHERPGEEAKLEQERLSASEARPLLPVAAGVFIIISSLLLLYSVLVSRTDAEDGETGVWFFGMLFLWPAWFQILMTLSGVMGIVGGLSAVYRRSQVIALIGGALSAMGIGAPLGLIGLLLVAMSEHQFDSQLSDFTTRSRGRVSCAIARSETTPMSARTAVTTSGPP